MVMEMIKNKNSRNKIIVVLLTIIALLAIGVVGYYLYSGYPSKNEATRSNPTKVNDINYSPPTKEQQEAGLEAKKESVETSPSPTPSVDGKAPSISITFANRSSIKTMIESVNIGTCTLQLTKPGSPTITKEANTQTLGSYSVCEGFDISTLDLSSGNWTATITYKEGVATSSATKVITVS
jgi:hypothetical protein